MGYRRFRAIAKVLCPSCRQKLDIQCSNCEFIKYNNVNKLTKFTQFLDEKYPSWIFFNVYRYKKNEPGDWLARYTNGKDPVRPFSDSELDHK